MTVQLRKILVPTDFSDPSSAAIRHAGELAAKFGAEVVILHVLEQHLSDTPDFAFGLTFSTYVSESRTAAERRLQKLRDEVRSTVERVSTALVEGSPKTEIVRYARTGGIDLIVMSTHGRSGIIHAIIGSVAESVIRTAECPVLTVPAAKQGD